MILPYTLIAGGCLLVATSFYPIAPVEWLPRAVTFLGGLWCLVVGVALVDLRVAMKGEK